MSEVTYVWGRPGPGTGFLVTPSARYEIVEFSRQTETETVRYDAHQVIDEKWIGSCEGATCVHGWTADTMLGAHSERREHACECCGEWEETVWVCDTTGRDVEPGLRTEPGGSKAFVASETCTITVTGEVPQPSLERVDAAITVVGSDGTEQPYALLCDVHAQGDVTFESGSLPTFVFVGSLRP